MRLYGMVLLATACCFAQAALAKKSQIVVGTCGDHTLTHTTTIQDAVNEVGMGGIVQVCPGIWAEQVTIGKALTLEGITGPDANGSPTNSSAAILVPPAAGLVANASDIDNPS